MDPNDGGSFRGCSIGRFLWGPRGGSGVESGGRNNGN